MQLKTVYIRDHNGNPILKLNRRTDRSEVSTPSGECLGHIRDGKTYDRNGNLVFYGEDPTLLLLRRK
jgi:hypothetical protein